MRRLLATITAVALSAAPLGAAASPAPTDIPSAPTERSHARLGVAVLELTPELRQHFGAAPDRGVLVGRVLPGSAAGAAGVRVGDVLVEVGGRAIAAPGDVPAALAPRRAGDHVSVVVLRAGARTALDVTLDDPRRGLLDMWRFFDGSTLQRWLSRDRAEGPRCEA
jgi:S1-C subfamily serine protease